MNKAIKSTPKVIPFYGNSKKYKRWYYSQFADTRFIFKNELVPESLMETLHNIEKKLGVEIDLSKIEGKNFFCAEQFMMVGKVLLFGPTMIDEYFKTCKHNSACKRFGRKVPNYNEKVWTNINLAWVTVGNYLKFSQNETLKDHLVKTGDALLVEASPRDSIWGVGMSVDHPDIMNPKKWKGLNKLGKALMKARELISEQ